MSTFKTTKGHVVTHDHPTPELSAAQIALARSFVSDLFPHSHEIKPPTNKYNCHGYALARSHGQFEPDLFLADDFDGASMQHPAVGDVVLYMESSLATHTARVTVVDGANMITELQSKWGEAAVVTHELEAVPDVYGIPVLLLRRRTPFAPHEDMLIHVEEDTAPENLPLEPALTSITDRARDRARFNLMLASTPAVRRRVIDSLPLSRQELSESASFSHVDTLKGGASREQIHEALAQLSSDRVQFMLMLASVDDVTTRIVASLPEVQTIAAMGPEAGMEVLDLFAREETQNNKRLTSILLHLLRHFKVREAAVPLFDYLFHREHSKYNRRLAAQALLAAAGLEQ